MEWKELGGSVAEFPRSLSDAGQVRVPVNLLDQAVLEEGEQVGIGEGRLG